MRPESGLKQGPPPQQNASFAPPFWNRPRPSTHFLERPVLLVFFLAYRAHQRTRHLRVQALAEPSALVPRPAGWTVSGACKRASTASPVEATLFCFLSRWTHRVSCHIANMRATTFVAAASGNWARSRKSVRTTRWADEAQREKA